MYKSRRGCRCCKFTHVKIRSSWSRWPFYTPDKTFQFFPSKSVPITFWPSQGQNVVFPVSSVWLCISYKDNQYWVNWKWCNVVPEWVEEMDDLEEYFRWHVHEPAMTFRWSRLWSRVQNRAKAEAFHSRAEAYQEGHSLNTSVLFYSILYQLKVNLKTSMTTIANRDAFVKDALGFFVPKIDPRLSCPKQRQWPYLKKRVLPTLFDSEAGNILLALKPQPREARGHRCSNQLSKLPMMSSWTFLLCHSENTHSWMIEEDEEAS